MHAYIRHLFIFSPLEHAFAELPVEELVYGEEVAKHVPARRGLRAFVSEISRSAVRRHSPQSRGRSRVSVSFQVPGVKFKG
jgi:hypothetical protein